jgi:hypothetical protein
MLSLIAGAPFADTRRTYPEWYFGSTSATGLLTETVYKYGTIEDTIEDTI